LRINSEKLKGKIDFGIISIREDEFEAVLKRFTQVATIEGRRHYALSKLITLDGSEYTIALVRCPEQGNGEGQNVARDLIEDLDPQWLLLVGIAGGVPADEYTLGDVIAASRLHDFTVTAHIEGNIEEFAVTGGPMHLEVQDLLAYLPAMNSDLGDWNSESSIRQKMPPVKIVKGSTYGNEQWKKRVRASLNRHFNDVSEKRMPIVTTGAIGSSDRLVKDTETLKQWRISARQLLAVEMELAGVYRAARRKDKEYPVLAIRGVSDIVGFKRHSDWTTYACNSAAAFAQAILKTKPIPPRNLDPSDVQMIIDGVKDKKETGFARIATIPKNIFRKRGALPIKAASYIERDCDSLLKRSLAATSLIAISGDYQMGKSSLLNQVESYLPHGWKSCYLDLSGTRTDDLFLLTSKFFRIVSEKLGNVESWDEINKLSGTQPLVFLFDEFGSLSIDRKIAHGFIPKLIGLTNSPSITIIVCLPEGIEQFIKEQNILNPKYWDSWLTVQVNSFTIVQTKQLLSLLPLQISRTITSHVSEIHRRANGHPRLLQCLCSYVFDSYQKGKSENDLIALLYQDSSYND
jgi:nucleoside phosphorylase